MKNLKFKSILCILTLFILSCDDVLVNENPNGFSLDKLQPEVVLPGAQVLTSSSLMTTMNGLGNLMTATWSGNAQQVQAPYFTEFQYQLSTDFYSSIWNGLFSTTSNFTTIINFESTENYDYFKSAAYICRAFYFQYLVDLYGDLPFSEAHQRDLIPFPSYDNQVSVYMDLITQLNTAIDLIENTDTVSALRMGEVDVMMSGDMDKWVRFANSIKLKLIVRMYDYAQTDVTALAFVNTEIATLNLSSTQFIGTGEDVTINPGYIDTSNNLNPFAAVYGYPAGEFGNSSNVTFGNRATGPTTFLVQYLNGTTTGVLDSRLSRLYTPRAGQASIQGNTQGGTGLPSMIGPGLLSSPSQDGYIMTASESLFLQSEAVHRGILTNGDAKSLFQEAITSSFNRLGATLGNYLTTSNAVEGIGWDGTSDKLQAIITQKWIDLGGTNGIETWIEHTRTGYPDMPLPDITSKTSRPIRLLYPTREYTGNTANVTPYNQTIDTAFETEIFWDVN